MNGQNGLHVEKLQARLWSSLNYTTMKGRQIL